MRSLATLVLALAILGGPASAATLDWMLHKQGGSGSVVDTTASGGFDASFVLFGNNCGKSKCPIDTIYSAVASKPKAAPGWKVDGAWSYLSLDRRGAAFDPFGFILNGVKTQLTADAGAAGQMGLFSLRIMPGDVFGWYVRSIDNKLGAGVATVAADVAPIPLPAAGWLLVGSLGALGAARRRRTVAA